MIRNIITKGGKKNTCQLFLLHLSNKWQIFNLKKKPHKIKGSLSTFTKNYWAIIAENADHCNLKVKFEMVVEIQPALNINKK